MIKAGRALLMACFAAVAPPVVHAAPISSVILPETGMASWYGDAFHGKKTANGEVYDMHALTAAHKSLPFGILVIVTNLADGRRVVVRINDRGPFIEGRIIDLSRAAAVFIGLDRVGTARVDVRPAPSGAALGPYHPPKPGAASATGAAKGGTAAAIVPAGQAGASVRIQVGSYRDEAHAKEAVLSLARIGLSAVIERSGLFFRVALYVQDADRSRVEAMLDAAGWTDRLVKEVKR